MKVDALNKSDLTGASSARSPNPLKVNVKDNYNFVYWVFCLIGIVLILPWNALIQSLGFLDANLPGKDITFMVSTVCNAPIFAAQIMMLKFGKFFNLRIVAVISLMLMTVLCVSIPLVTEYIHNVDTLWVVILIILIVFCFTDGLLQSAGYGYAGPFPSRIIASLSNGWGLSGVVIGICRAISLLCFPTANNQPDDPNLFKGAVLYFTLASCSCTICCLLFLIVLQTQYNVCYNPTVAQKILQTHANGTTDTLISLDEDYADVKLHKTPENERRKGVQEASILKIHNEFWMVIYGNVINFTLTFVIFPGLLLQGHISFIHDDDWRSWFVIFLFTVFDTVSRYFWSMYMIRSAAIAGLLTIIRFSLLGTSFLCAYEVSFFSSDVVKVINIVLVSFSSGYLANCQMIIGCSYPAPHERETASKMMNLTLVLGILLGSLIATFGISRLF